MLLCKVVAMVILHQLLECRTLVKCGLTRELSMMINYAPNFEKVDGAYCFWSVRGCVRAWVTLFVPTVTFKPLKLES